MKHSDSHPRSDEGFDDLWHARYRSARPADSAVPAQEVERLLAHLMAHRTVRAYLNAPLPPNTLAQLMAAAQSAATSSNLQAWSVVAVQDPERKSRLAACAGSQAHVIEAPMLLVWVADLSRLDRTASRAGSASDANAYFEMFLVAAIDAALAAQNAVLAAEAMGLGTSYIGALRNQPEVVARELGLPPNAFAVFGLTIGVPDPARATAIKPRLPQTVVLHRETYQSTVPDEIDGIAVYDQAMQRFQQEQGMKLQPWSVQSSQRVAGPESLSGRDRLVDALHALGFRLR